MENICRNCKHWASWGSDTEHDQQSRQEEKYSRTCKYITSQVKDTTSFMVNLDQGRGWDAGGASFEDIETPPHFGCNQFVPFK
jgi:protein-arginine kinase activator protein McsA